MKTEEHNHKKPTYKCILLRLIEDIQPLLTESGIDFVLTSYDSSYSGLSTHYIQVMKSGKEIGTLSLDVKGGYRPLGVENIKGVNLCMHWVANVGMYDRSDPYNYLEGGIKQTDLESMVIGLLQNVKQVEKRREEQDQLLERRQTHAARGKTLLEKYGYKAKIQTKTLGGTVILAVFKGDTSLVDFQVHSSGVFDNSTSEICSYCDGMFIFAQEHSLYQVVNSIWRLKQAMALTKPVLNLSKL